MGVPTTQVGLHIDRSVFAGILDAVRNGVLESAVKLEKSGILGDSLPDVLAHLRSQTSALGLQPGDETKFRQHLDEAEAGSTAANPGRVARALKSAQGLVGTASNKVVEIAVKALIDKYLGPS